MQKKKIKNLIIDSVFVGWRFSRFKSLNCILCQSQSVQELEEKFLRNGKVTQRRHCMLLGGKTHTLHTFDGFIFEVFWVGLNIISKLVLEVKTHFLVNGWTIVWTMDYIVRTMETLFKQWTTLS